MATIVLRFGGIVSIQQQRRAYIVAGAMAGFAIGSPFACADVQADSGEATKSPSHEARFAGTETLPEDTDQEQMLATHESPNLSQPSFCFRDDGYCGPQVSSNYGSSFSPGGIGLQVGFEINRFNVYAGVGLLSKGNHLGLPLFGGVKTALTARLFADTAFSYFAGSGSQFVLFNDADQTVGDQVNCALWNACSIGANVRAVDVKWQLVYGHVGLGLVAWQFGPLRLEIEGGIGANLLSRLTLGESDQGRYGKPQRIVFKDDLRVAGVRAGAGKGDTGAFVRLELNYVLRHYPKTL